MDRTTDGLPDVAAAVIEAAARRVRVFPARSNWASQIGHECERYLVWCRTRWQDKAPIDGLTKLLFEGSGMTERVAREQLEGAGYRLTEEQRHFDWPDYQIGGNIDGRLSWGGERQRVPLEIKGSQPFDWEKVNSAEDMVLSDKPWVRRYPFQILAYMWMMNSPVGLFYYVNKTTYRPKAIWLHLDDWLEPMEACLQKLERVNAAVAAGVDPEPMDYDDKTCKRCDFAHVCLPDRDWGPGVEFLENDAKFVGSLSRWSELREGAKEWQRLDKSIKARMKDAVPEGEMRQFLAGGFHVKGEWKGGKFYTKIQEAPA